jgi:DNA-binding transcriptional regulator LsrR (DeoR family)
MHRVEVTLGALQGHVAGVLITDKTAARDILQADAHEQAHPEDP